MATDALVLKHQGISIHSADWISIAMYQFQMKNITFLVKNKYKFEFLKQMTDSLKVKTRVDNLRFPPTKN